MHPHEHLTRARLQLRHLDQFHHLRLAELFYTDRFHRLAILLCRRIFSKLNLHASLLFRAMVISILNILQN